MTERSESEFGVIRSIFWPVHSHELKKLLPMLIIGFLICLNYSILRNCKDSIVVTASGAEVIPYIKLWALLPMAVLMTSLFTKLTNYFNQETVFYIVITSFLAFFALFGFVLYPLRDTLHLAAFAEFACQNLPLGCKGFVMMCRDWSFTLFYTISELWGSLVLSILFWGFANEVTKLAEARRFYGVISIGANIGAILAGYIGTYISNGFHYNANIPFGKDAWEQSVAFLTIIVLVSGGLSLCVYYWMNRKVLSGLEYDELHKKRIQFSKEKLSLKESFIHLSRSKYLICIAIMLVAYNLTINLVEVVWKDQLRQVYVTAADFNEYMGFMTMFMGVLATILACMMSWLLNRFGWFFTACITPVIILVTSLGFFGSMAFKDQLGPLLQAAIGTTPVTLAVFFGAAQNCLSKAAKYSVFDMTKEMAFIPLDHESRIKGKAAIDGVGSRLGKSGGAVVHQGLLFFFITLSSCAPYLAVIVIITIVAWMLAVKNLSGQFESASEPVSVSPVEAPA